MIRNNNSWFNRIKSWALVVEDRSLHFWFWSVELWMPLWSFKTWRNYKLLNSNINNTVSLKQLNKNCIDQYIFETWFSIYSIHIFASIWYLLSWILWSLFVRVCFSKTFVVLADPYTWFGWLPNIIVLLIKLLKTQW